MLRKPTTTKSSSLKMVYVKSEIRRYGGKIIRTSENFPIIYAYRCKENFPWDIMEVIQNSNGSSKKIYVSRVCGHSIVWI